MTSYIGGMEGCGPIAGKQDGCELVRDRPLKSLNGFARVAVVEVYGCADGGEPVPIDKRVERVSVELNCGSSSRPAGHPQIAPVSELPEFAGRG